MQKHPISSILWMMKCPVGRKLHCNTLRLKLHVWVSHILTPLKCRWPFSENCLRSNLTCSLLSSLPLTFCFTLSLLCECVQEERPAQAEAWLGLIWGIGGRVSWVHPGRCLYFAQPIIITQSYRKTYVWSTWACRLQLCASMLLGQHGHREREVKDKLGARQKEVLLLYEVNCLKVLFSSLKINSTLAAVYVRKCRPHNLTIIAGIIFSTGHSGWQNPKYLASSTFFFFTRQFK